MDKEAEWIDKRCPKCNARLLALGELIYCSFNECDYGLDNDVTFDSYPFEVSKEGNLVKPNLEDNG